MNLCFDIAYDGTNFHGWASQPKLRTVQGEISAAIATMVRVPVELIVAGRTDAGVHASGQVAHTVLSHHLLEQLNLLPTSMVPFSFPGSNNSPMPLSHDHGVNKQKHCDGEDEVCARQTCSKEESTSLVETLPRFTYRLNSILHMRGVNDCVIRRTRIVPDVFHARFCALDRTYCYRIGDSYDSWIPTRRDIYHMKLRQPLDVDCMDDAAQVFIGEHDFLAFAKPRLHASTIREVFCMKVVRNYMNGCVEVWVQADAFCHSQVRFMVGALITLGRKQRDKSWLEEILFSRQRTGALSLAPACGLTLERVNYPFSPVELAAQMKKAQRYRG